MELSLQAARCSTWLHAERTCFISSQVGLMGCKPRMRFAGCRADTGASSRAPKDNETASSSSSLKGLMQWVQPDSDSDPYRGWTSDGFVYSQGNDNLDLIKTGGGFILAIGFAIGTWTLYSRKDIKSILSSTAPVTAKTVTNDKIGKLQKAPNNLDCNDDLNDAAKDKQDAEIEKCNTHENQTEPNESSPSDPHEETTISERAVISSPADKLQERALASLQTLKVIEPGMDPGSICSRREYARWLIKASSILLRSPSHKIFPAIYLKGVTRLAFDDVLPEDPDFPYIQGLAEAGLIASKLDGSNECVFSPDSPLTRQDLVTWKPTLGVEPGFALGISSSDGKKMLKEASGFIDIGKIRPDAWSALLADVNAGERGIIALAFGYTRRFQPDKPVTKGQAAIAVASGESWELVAEELARLEAESIAEAAIVAELALEKKAQQEVDAAFNKLLQEEKEKQAAAASLVETVKAELERVKLERDEEKQALLKERAALDSEKQMLSGIRQNVEEQSLALSNARLETAFEKEQLERLRADVEEEKSRISKIRSELDVEKNALSLARAWAEEEARKAHEHAKVLNQARQRWEAQGIQVHVDKDLDESNIPGLCWQYSQECRTEGIKANMGRLLEKRRDIIQFFEHVVNRFLNFWLVVLEAIKQLVSVSRNQVEDKFQQMRAKSVDTMQELVRGMRRSTSSSLIWASEGPSKAFDHLKGGAKLFAKRLKPNK